MLKAIIADDERKARTILRHLGNWTENGVELAGEAENGDELLALVRERSPDIVLTDMRMPGTSGAELIRALHEFDPELKIVIVSGYDDFAYAKEAIASRAVDYLLKPIEEEALHAALRRAAEEVRAERERRQSAVGLAIRANAARGNEQTKLLRKLFQGLPIGQEEWSAFAASSVGSPGTAIRAVILRIDRFHRLRERYGPDLPLLHFAVANVVEEVATQAGAKALCREIDTNELAVLLAQEPGAKAIDLEALLAEWTEGFGRLFGVGLLAGVGRSGTDLTGAMRSAEEAKMAMWGLQPALSNVAVYEERSFRPRAASSLPLDRSNALRTAIDIDDVETCGDVIGQLLEALARSRDWRIGDLDGLNRTLLAVLKELGAHVEDAYAYSLEWDRLSGRLAAEPDPEAAQALYLGFLRGISPALAGSRRRRETNALYSIRRYIEENYMSKLTLADLSGMFFMSEEHISRAFKEEFGVNLFQYLMRLKIDKAKQLLVQSAMKTAELGDLLGFVDASHFAKAFRKHEGCSPKEYRDRSRKDCAGTAHQCRTETP